MGCERISIRNVNPGIDYENTKGYAFILLFEIVFSFKHFCSVFVEIFLNILLLFFALCVRRFSQTQSYSTYAGISMATDLKLCHSYFVSGFQIFIYIFQFNVATYGDFSTLQFLVMFKILVAFLSYF